MERFEFVAAISRLGQDHVSVELDVQRDLIVFRRDARDIESVHHLSRDQWTPFLADIGEPGASGVVEGVQHAVAGGRAAKVMRAVQQIGRLVFSHVDAESWPQVD